MKIKTLAAATALMAVGSMAYAVPTYVADYGTDGPGTGLQDTLDSRTLDNNFDQDVKTDQYQPDEAWTLDAVARANAVMMFEIAGNSSSNSLGIYDLNNTANRLSLFDGSAANGFSSRLAINGNGDFVVTQFDADEMVLGQQVGTFSTFNFGFYLSTPSDTFFSQSALNNDLNGDGIDDDHMIAIQGTGTDKLDTSGTGTFWGDFTSNNFILAWEDLSFDNGGVDYDYNDLVVMVESFIPVPEPGTLALLGLGLVGLGAARRRKA